jgi:hypothetical protein
MRCVKSLTRGAQSWGRDDFLAPGIGLPHSQSRLTVVMTSELWRALQAQGLEDLGEIRYADERVAVS